MTYLIDVLEKSIKEDIQKISELEKTAGDDLNDWAELKETIGRANSEEWVLKQLEQEHKFYNERINKTCEVVENILNAILPNEYTVSIIETSELYLDDEDIEKPEEEDREYYLKPMYEAYIEKDEEQLEDYITGRYCAIEDVVLELHAQVEIFCQIHNKS